MHANPEALRAARLALLEAAVCALMRDAVAEELDGLDIAIRADRGEVSIDLMYLKGEQPMTGFDL